MKRRREKEEAKNSKSIIDASNHSGAFIYHLNFE